MRCLTLAVALKKRGADVSFISRAHLANLNNLIRANQIWVDELPIGNPENLSEHGGYLSWLGTSEARDAQLSGEILRDKSPEWLVVDHYALGKSWQDAVRRYVKRIMVIDDLANRRHACDLLLDQNYFAQDINPYFQLVGHSCRFLLGPQYALLREEFIKEIQKSEAASNPVKRLFAYFGAADSYKLSEKLVNVLSSPHFRDLQADIVIGASGPDSADVQSTAALCGNINVHEYVDGISKLMVEADIAIGAGGATTWERLALGVPSLVITVAENQVRFTRELHNDGFLQWLGPAESISEQELFDALLRALHEPSKLAEAARRGKQLVDGRGVERVVTALEEMSS